MVVNDANYYYYFLPLPSLKWCKSTPRHCCLAAAGVCTRRLYHVQQAEALLQSYTHLFCYNVILTVCL